MQGCAFLFHRIPTHNCFWLESYKFEISVKDIASDYEILLPILIAFTIDFTIDTWEYYPRCYKVSDAKTLKNLHLSCSIILRFELVNHAYHVLKGVRIRSFSGPYFSAFGLNKSPYSDQMQENTDQKNSE